MTATFTAAKATQAELERAVADASGRLTDIQGVGSGAMGLTPDAVKAAPEYRAARAAYDRAFRQLQQFNAWFVPTFAAELRAERRTRHV